MKCLFFFPSKWSQNVSIESWFLNKNWTQKLSFRKIFFLQNMIFRKDLFSKAARMKNFQFKTNLTFWKFFISNFHCAGKPFFQDLILFFFGKTSFQTLTFNERVCYKVMPFKMSTQSDKLVVVRGANRVKTLFLICDVFYRNLIPQKKIELKI